MSDPQVTVRLQGRLGNNLFQAAALLAYANRHSLTWALPTGYTETGIYQLGIPVGANLADRAVWKEPKHGYTPIPAPCRLPMLLDGFFQSWRCFDDQKDAVRAAIRLPARNQLNQVSISVRRINMTASGSWRLLALSYYARAIHWFQERAYNDFLVLSDDIEWCQANLTAFNAKLEFCEESNPVQALALMASCNGHILANSTFSWWGAWLSGSNSPIVAPVHQDWFGDDLRDVDTGNLYPSNWVELPTT